MIKEWKNLVCNLIGLTALAYLIGMAFGYGVTQMIEAKTYIIEVHDTTEHEVK